MSKPKYVTRRIILEAIRKEPLASIGHFVLLQDDESTFYQDVPSSDPNCPVCAVGGVLRRAGLDNKDILSFGEKMMDETDRPCATWALRKCKLDQDISYLLNEKAYLHALSVKFEHHVQKLGAGKRTRKILIDFVKKNFPLKVKLDPSL